MENYGEVTISGGAFINATISKADKNSVINIASTDVTGQIEYTAGTYPGTITGADAATGFKFVQSGSAPKKPRFKVKGKMKATVPDNADMDLVKSAYESTIADKMGVEASQVEATFTAERRLEEGNERRLASKK